MALIVADRVQETSTTTGTGAFTLAAAVTGYRRFSAVCSTSDTVYYVIVAVDGNGNPSGDWECGLGTYSSANTLTRTTPQASSNAGAAVNFAAGTKYVILDATAAYLGTAYRSGGTDVALADGGTGASLVDPNADRILFWDDSAGTMTWLQLGTNLSISGTTLNASGGGSGLNHVTTTTVVNNENNSTLIPHDSTIPQITEGLEAFSLSITPSSTTARIRVEADFTVRHSNSGIWTIGALFINGGSDAVAVVPTYQATAGGAHQLRLVYEYVPGSTSAQTLSLRYGPTAGCIVTIGSIGSSTFGGMVSNRMSAWEVVP